MPDELWVRDNERPYSIRNSSRVDWFAFGLDVFHSISTMPVIIGRTARSIGVHYAVCARNQVAWIHESVQKFASNSYIHVQMSLLSPWALLDNPTHATKQWPIMLCAMHYMSAILEEYICTWMLTWAPIWSQMRSTRTEWKAKASSTLFKQRRTSLNTLVQVYASGLESLCSVHKYML